MSEAPVRPVVQPVARAISPEALVAALSPATGAGLLRSDYFEAPQARYSFVVANPFLVFRSSGSRCALSNREGTREFYGNPWHALDSLMARYELLDELDFPFPLGGCFGFWGYDLKNFVEPKLGRRAVNDLEWPDCWVGFYSSLVVFDHRLGAAWVVASGLKEDGSRSLDQVEADLRFWETLFDADSPVPSIGMLGVAPFVVRDSFTREAFIERVRRAQEYIRLGHIYQVNLSHRLSSRWDRGGWDFFLRLKQASPAPFSSYLHCGDFEIASSSPEMFLHLSGAQIRTRPIKGTRPRDADSTRDAQLSFELQTSAKEISELVMITDLLRNDLGRFCEYGSVTVPDLVRLEKYPHVQHLVSTVEGRLRDGVTHFDAFARSFPGGSITGAPKIRAMEIIDELEPISRGPYTGALGYLGFNRESQLAIAIRTALVKDNQVHFNVGAGIVADSNPEAEYDETIAKAGGFFGALGSHARNLREYPDPAIRSSFTVL